MSLCNQSSQSSGLHTHPILPTIVGGNGKQSIKRQALGMDRFFHLLQISNYQIPISAPYV
jgi:hypothetical protein